MTTGERIQALLKARGMTQKELAEKAGITPESVCKYVKGKTVPNIIIFAKMAKVLHTTTDFIFGIESDDTNKDIYTQTLFDIKNHAKNWTAEQKAQLVNVLFKV